MSTLIERLDKWLAANRPDYYKELEPGAAEEQVAALRVPTGCEAARGVRRYLSGD